MNDFFFNCTTEFKKVSSTILDFVKQENQLWQPIYGIDVCRIDRKFFTQFPEVDKIMTDFKCERHSVFRFPPNTCYGWHIDNPGRTCALNMLLEGPDSHTFYGNPAQLKENEDYIDITEVKYDPAKFVLMNVHKHHTVYNLNNVRYLLTISFHPRNGNFEDIKKYLIENNF
jgi:hypothetical protein